MAVIAFAVFVNQSAKPKSIYERIGTYEPYSTTAKDALFVKAYGLDSYVDGLLAGDYEYAYGRLSEDYRNFFSYEDYQKTLEGIDFSTFEVQSIKLKAENTYVADVSYKRNGETEETTYLLYKNQYHSENITISPDKFIYAYQNMNFENNPLAIAIKECAMYTDHIELEVTVKNQSSKENIELSTLILGYTEGVNLHEDISCILKPGEERKLFYTIQTNYYLPNNIKIKRKLDEETLRTYTFYFEERIALKCE